MQESDLANQFFTNLQWQSVITSLGLHSVALLAVAVDSSPAAGVSNGVVESWLSISRGEGKSLGCYGTKG